MFQKKTKFPQISILISTLLFILLVILFLKNIELQSYINLVSDKYKIPTSQSIKNTIPEGSKFIRQDAFGITLVDIPSLLGGHYLIDPNHKNSFHWIDPNGKEIDLTNKSNYIYIGIPLKPEDIGAKNPENVSYVNQIFQKLISVFENSGFKLNKSFSKMELFGFDNQAFVDIVAFENSIGTKCTIRKPEQYNYSEFSRKVGGYSNIGYRSLVYIYVACVDQ